MAANQNEVDVLKQSMTNWITSLLQVLEMSEIENNTHLRTWIYGMLDARNAPFLGHNLAALVQEILVVHLGITSDDEIHESLVNLNQQMLEVLSNAPTPRILEAAEEQLNDYYGRILNDESLREICQNVLELAKQSRREKLRLNRMSHYAENDSVIKGDLRPLAMATYQRYLRLRLSLKQKLEEFLRKFLDVETALNDQHN